MCYKHVKINGDDSLVVRCDDDYSLTNHIMAQGMLNIAHQEIMSALPLNSKYKWIAINILRSDIKYAKIHTPYKSYQRIMKDIYQYDTAIKPFDAIISGLFDYKTADQLISNLNDDRDYRDSDGIGLDSQDERDYDSICNWLSEKKNIHQIFKDLYDNSLDPKDYTPLTRKDMTNIFKRLMYKISNMKVSASADAKFDRDIKRIRGVKNEANN